jgi:hypothetical protein
LQGFLLRFRWVEPVLKGSDWHVYTFFSLSIDGLIMASGAPPTVATKYAFVQRVGRRLVLRSRSSLSVFAAQAQYDKQLGGGQQITRLWIGAQLHS